jgi:hypothetical protein
VSVHLAALVLVEHQPMMLPITTRPADTVRCCCNTAMPWREFHSHQARALDEAGLLAPGTPAETPTERVREARPFQDAPD